MCRRENRGQARSPGQVAESRLHAGVDVERMNEPGLETGYVSPEYTAVLGPIATLVQEVPILQRNLFQVSLTLLPG